MNKEEARIIRLKEIFNQTSHKSVELGIGDDAAVLQSIQNKSVISVDVAVENVHFRRDFLTLEELGYRSIMAAMSDLAAMGSTPIGALSSLILPKEFSDADLESLALGQFCALQSLQACMLGGNLSSGKELSITTTVVGHCNRPLCRNRAYPGDLIWVAGKLGYAAVGLEILKEDGNRIKDKQFYESFVQAWKCPMAQIVAGIEASSKANAGIDISDGLALDLTRLGEDSHVKIILEKEKLMDLEISRASEELKKDPMDFILHGGEDYSLVVSASPEIQFSSIFKKIGYCEMMRDEDLRRVVLRTDNGDVIVNPKGWDHFSEDSP